MARTKKAVPSPTEDKVYDGVFTYIDLNEKEVKVKYKEYISLQKMGECIHNIVNNVIDDEYGYFPYLYDISLYSNLLEYYTDFDTSVSTDKLVDMLNKTDIKCKLEQHLSTHQTAIIIDAVYKMIEFEKQKLVSKSEFDGLISDIRVLVNKFGDTIDADTVRKAMSNLSAMGEISEKGLIDALVKKSGVGKIPKGKKSNKSKGGESDSNVVDFPWPGQVDLEGNIVEGNEEET